MTHTLSSLEFHHGSERFTVYLHRTLRLPEDGRAHDLPPSMGHFPIRRIEDYRDRVPVAWREHGGVFFPMWQREAMWLQFQNYGRARAVKVAAGKVNAVSGEVWQPALAPAGGNALNPRQDYLVAPPQPWLDGFNAGDGRIRQFVAMPLGMGYTVEAQVTGREDVGGLQILVVPPKPGRLAVPAAGYSIAGGIGGGAAAAGVASGGAYVKTLSGSPYGKHQIVGSMNPRGMRSGGPLRGGPTLSAQHTEASTNAAPPAEGWMEQEMYRSTNEPLASKGAEMGLGQGGEMVQKIYPDPHGLDAWDEPAATRLFVHIVNSELWRQITGEAPPPSPITAQSYARKGYPWFHLWDAEMGDVPASGVLQDVKTVGQMDQKHGFSGQQDDSPVYEKSVSAGGVKPGAIAEGKEWGASK